MVAILIKWAKLSILDFSKIKIFWNKADEVKIFCHFRQEFGNSRIWPAKPIFLGVL